MKEKDTRKALEAHILDCKKRLQELAMDIELDEQKAKEYNRIIVQKAILVDRYKKLCFKPTLKQRIKKAIRNSFIKKEKLICDYFLS